MDDLLKLFVDMENVEYGEEQYYQDLLSFAKALQIKNNSKRDSWISNQVQRKYTSYSIEDIEGFLAEPRSNEKQLREVARYLENTSQIFQRVIGYLPNINMICPIVIPTRP